MKKVLPDTVVPAATDEWLRTALEKAGARFTRQRAAVFSYLRSVDCHPTADQVYAAVQRSLPHISLATVYKALEVLVQAGLAVKVGSGDGPARYDHRCEAHYHFRCLTTGQVHDVPVPFDESLLGKLDPVVIEELRALGFHVTSHRLELLGHFEQDTSRKRLD